MPTWSDIQQHMRRSYQLQDDRPEMLSMVWSYDDGRSQKVIMRRYYAFEREMVEFKSAFARADDVEAGEMLRKNSELPLATIALANDVYIVVYNALVDHLAMDDLDLYLSRIAAVADALEETYGRRDEF